METSSNRASFSSRVSVDSGPLYSPSFSPPHQHPPDNTVSTASRSRTVRSASHSRNLSSSSHASSISAFSLKSRHAEPDITQTHADRASLSVPPPVSHPQMQARGLKAHRSSLSQTRRESFTNPITEDNTNEPPQPAKGRNVVHSSNQSSHRDFAVQSSGIGADHDPDPSISPALMSGSLPESSQSLHPSVSLPDSGHTSGRSSLSDADASKRVSVGSVYSLASARGVPIPGSDASSPSASGASRSVSGLMASSSGTKGPGSSPLLEPDVSNVTVTTGSQGAAGGHHLAPRDAHSYAQHPNETPNKRTPAAPPRSDPTANPRPPQPTRSRSRAKRRFSNSTAASSHSPSSDRAFHRGEREEVKPAPLGVIGVCALDVKARSKPSRNILNRLIANREFDVCVFGDKVILDEEKAIAYVKARRPFCVNDVPMQKVLWDRRLCLWLLDKIGVPTPERIEVNRDGGPKILTPDIAKHIKDVSGIALEPTSQTPVQPPKKIELLDDGDVLSVDGACIRKPYVEKPTSGEDHNIIVYFPRSAGGGARKLFRKIGNKSSEFVPDLVVPRAITQSTGSYIYERFMRIDNAEDVKAYTVGPTYCHAETRKSPVVDGVVRRNTHGKEVRYVTGLGADEREVAGKISLAFGQRVCGFDFLRADGKSYVIDVNGWSFVKDNDEYYDHCAGILRDLFVKERIRRGNPVPTLPVPVPGATEADHTSAHSPQLWKDKDTLGAGQISQVLSPSSSSAPVAETSELRSPPAELAGTSRSESAILASKLQSAATSPRSAQGQAAESTPSTAPSTVPATPPLQPELSPDMQDSREEMPPPPPPPPKHLWKLKGMVSVIRHADRTPKQKYKFTFHTEPFIELLKGHQEEVLLVGEAALTSVIDAVDTAMIAGVEDRSKLRALRNVLVKKGTWAGTKVQIKPMFRKKKSDEITPVEDKAVLSETEKSPSLAHRVLAGKDPDGSKNRSPGSSKRHDSLSGVTMSKFTAAENSLVLDKLQLIVKWGGEPTHSARYQSQELGDNMRNDLLLLNRDILDDIYVYSSSERRVITSAQIWAASFLGQKDVPEDTITIRKDLLDDSNAAKDETDKVKKKLKGLLRKGNERPPEFAWPENMPEPSEVQTRVVQLMNFHRRVMQYNYSKLYNGSVTSLNVISNPGAEKAGSEGSSNTSLASSLSQANTIHGIQARWCCGEDAELFRERWEKLFAEFCDGEKVDPSKISELYDTMKFDALHNRQFLEWVFTPPRTMLEEEYGIAATSGSGNGKETKTSPQAPSNTRKSSEDGLSRDHQATEDPKAERPQVAGAVIDRIERSDANKTVKRILRRRSWMNGLRHVDDLAQPEQYFHLFKGNNQTKAKTDAKFEPLRELYQLAKILFDFICPQEYGISDSEKLEIGLLTSLPLLKEIVQDLEEMQASDEAKGFFYFTKESHIYTLLNCIFEGGIETKITRRTIPELDYLSQICFELYESETKAAANPKTGTDETPTFAYSIRITISPGCHVFDPLDVQLDSKHCIGCAPRRSLTPHGDWKQIIETLRAKFHQVKLPKTFLAVNLSEAFSFQERHGSEPDVLEMRSLDPAATPTAQTTDEEQTVEVAPASLGFGEIGKQHPSESSS